MNNYNIIADTETEKYNIMAIIRANGGRVTGVSGYYGGAYYIQFDATEKQAAVIDAALRRENICG